MTDGGTQDGVMAALGRVPSGLFILTARHGRQETGMLASWIQQCSFDPPQITAAFARDRWLLDWLTDGAAFAVNVIAEGQKQLMSHFGKGFDRSEKAFEGIEVQRNGDSAPVLVAAHAFLDCRVVRQVPAGDHVLVIGRVVAGGVLNEARPATHVRRSGKHY
jgi:flavin reductase (DIM6/NTAB) family NADH-FMN oxidoreductase RutF